MTVKRYGAFGTEGSFKALSGHDISLLHIATHGFSCTPGKEDAKWLEEISPQAFLNSSSSDMLLNYSGLVFSGCNNIIKLKDKKKFPKDIDDGILTAQEIAQLNLQNLHLTVLSACQTGTGMLQEDGVFGVQRGFKKAGAHTLVMSLWSVSDPVTMLMMTSFYEALQNEPSLTKAFLKAQKTVREQYPRPQDWAPFIMLDDI